MDCHHVTEHQVVDRYVMNQLTAEEVERFEDHYMSCDACLDELERAEVMARGFKRVGAEEIAAARTLAAGIAWWRHRQLWMGGAVAVLAAAISLPLFLGGSSGGTADSRANTPVVYLQPERSSGAAPSRQLNLPDAPGSIVLVLELDPPFYPSYRAVVEHAGRHLLELEGLELGERDSVTLSIDSHLLTPGDYVLALESPGVSDRPIAVGQFAFRVLQ